MRASLAKCLTCKVVAQPLGQRRGQLLGWPQQRALLAGFSQQTAGNGAGNRGVRQSCVSRIAAERQTALPSSNHAS